MKTKLVILIFIFTILFLSGILFTYFKKKQVKYCDSYQIPMSEEQIQECICPVGQKKLSRVGGVYCATNSQKTCRSHADCPKNEKCISFDKQNWFCTGDLVGCYYENPDDTEKKICVD